MKRILFLITLLMGGNLAHAAIVREGALSGAPAIGYGGSAIDTAGGYAYFVDTGTYFPTFVPPLQIHVLTRVRLADFSTALSAVFVTSVTAAVIQQTNNVVLADPAGGFVYTAFGQSSSTIAKFQLTTFAFVSSATVSGPGPFSCGVIDAVNDFAYFGSETSPANILKIRLSDLSIISSMTLPAGQAYLRAAVLDTSIPNQHFAYFGSSTATGGVAKIDLRNFSFVSALSFNSGEGAVVSGFLDGTVGSAWFGTNDSPGKIVRVNLNTFQRTDAMTLNSGENRLTSALYDPVNRLAYFGTETSTGIVVRIRPVSMHRDTALSLETGEGFLKTVAYDNVNHYGYFGAVTNPGQVIKVDLIGGAPEILSAAPPEEEVPVGQSATFTVSALGRNLTYQWNRDAVPVGGATQNIFQIANTTLNDDGVKVTCTVTNSSGTATTGETVLTVQPDIHVFPSPWRADRHSGVPLSFGGLPPGAVVKIFTLAAQWVQNVPESGGVAAWDLKNSAGQNAASGYYFYFVQTRDDRHQIRGKFAIIR